MKHRAYVFASLSRGESLGFRWGGPGLGNLLFPWARAVAFAKKHDLPRINSTWKTIKLGPILRGEFDKRFYGDLFEEHEIGGLKKFLLLQFGKRYDERHAEDALHLKRSTRPSVIVFHGLGDSFRSILRDHDLIAEELWKITLPTHRKVIEAYENEGIAVHIRMGDFAIAENEEILRQGKWNYRLPIKWYANVIENIRTYAGVKIPVHIFSDGTDEELAKILNLENVHRKFLGSAVADMLALAKSPMLIASASTFSMWASYLGRMPVIWFPGVHRLKLYEEEVFEGTLDYDQALPEKLKADIERLFVDK